MRKLKEVGAREGFRFCGLTTLKSQRTRMGMLIRLSINYMKAANFVGDKKYDLQKQKE